MLSNARSSVESWYSPRTAPPGRATDRMRPLSSNARSRDVCTRSGAVSLHAAPL
jgi:hypothetical protein